MVKSENSHLRGYVALLLATWSVLVVALAWWSIHQEYKSGKALALHEARAHFNKDWSFRLWASSHGGVYVPTDERTPPSPHLSHIKDRDVVTPGGRKLTLMNPAYMVRQVMEEHERFYGVKGRIVSLKPLNPGNTPDEWERDALVSFEQGSRESSEFTEVKGAPHVRLMRPLVTDESCLKCHAQQGYKEGEIRGAMGVSVPIVSLLTQARRDSTQHIIRLVLLWGLGAAIIVLGYLAISRRQRERDLAIVQVAESEKRYRQLVENTDDLITRVDANGLITYTNSASLQYWGVPPDECIGSNAFVYIHPDDREATSKQFQEWLASGKDRITFENRQLHKSGQARHCRWSISAARNEAGEVVEFCSIAHDVTEHKSAERALLESEEKFRSLVENAQELVWKCDAEGKFTYLNPAWEKSHGYKLDEMLGHSFGDFQRPEVFERDVKEFAKHMAGGKVKAYETTHLAKDGSELTLLFNAAPIEDDAGTVIGTQGTAVDLTVRKELEKQRLELERQIDHAQKMESLGVLAGGVAHDFNNLLSAIIGFSELLQLDTPKDSPSREYVDSILEGAERGSELTGQMLAYAGKGNYVVESIDLNELVTGMTRLLSVSVTKHADIQCDLAQELPPVKVDTAQVRQVVMNLIINAGESIDSEDGKIRVTSGTMDCDDEFFAEHCPEQSLASGTYVFVKVKDNGRGMDKPTLARLFEPFFTTKKAGRGLGLSAVLGIIHGHGGAILVDSILGEGTTFTVLLPPGDAPALSHTTGGKLNPNWRGSGLVLVVEDDEAVCQIATTLLETIGFDVKIASDGVEGVACFKEHAEELVLAVLDLALPRMDGVEALKEFRRIRKDVPVVVVSGQGDKSVRQRFKDTPPDAFMHKPYSLAGLQAVVRQYALLDRG